MMCAMATNILTENDCFFDRTAAFFKSLVFCLPLFSCTYNPPDEGRFPHRFQQGGKADYLYHVTEILGENPVFENEEKMPLFLPLKDSDEIDSTLFSVRYPNRIVDQGEVKDLLKIQTAEKGEKAVISFAQDNIRLDPNISFINEYESLDYSILNADQSAQHTYLARLLGKVKFKGFRNTDYYILPLFMGNWLVLYKVGPQDKIPYNELPLARRVGDMLAVPLVGYPVEYCDAEVIPDVNERETGQYRPKCEGIQMKSAEYIYLKEGGKKLFKYKPKPDLFPRDFFNLREHEDGKNKWFYVRTVVKSPGRKIEGHQLFQASNLVEFHPIPGKLDVLDASGYNIRSEDKIRALFIPVEWVDYQIKRDSENLHPEFKEEERTNILERNLRYFRIKFDDLVTNEIEFPGEKTLKEVVITDDYFSFDVEITGKSQGAYLLKYAFFKKPVDESENYIPKQWFEEDSTQFFPSFAEKRRYYKSALDYSEADHDRFFRTTRFNPKAGQVKWYFSTQTPNDPEHQWVRELGHLAVKLLNKAFLEAGRDADHKIEVVLDSNGDDKEVGDIRYNILNLIVSEGTGGGLLGLGPNVANPITGEVVSATANVWVDHIINIYISVVRNYIRFHVYPPAWKLSPFSPKVTASLAEQINEKTPECGALPLQPLGVTPFLKEKIKNVCKEEVTDFIDEQKKDGVTYDPENPDLEDGERVKSCAKKLAFLPILGVTLHEILHGFAQRHIFSASVDNTNFYKNYDEIKKIFGDSVSKTVKGLFGDLPFVEGTNCHPHPPQYSSVMDYMDFYNPLLFVPGKLDIAALRFIYFDKVDLKGGGTLEVPSGADRDPGNSQKSILQAADAKKYEREDIKSYKVLCGGYKLLEKGGNLETDPNQPLCKQWDYGANPLEITVNSILKTNNYLMNGRNRYDSADILSLFGDPFEETAGDLYTKWKQYRDELLSQNGRSIEDYPFYDPQSITQYETIIEAERTVSPEFKMYSDIRRPIFNYFKRLAFMPVKHCVYKKKVHGTEENDPYTYSAVALEKIMTEEKGDYKKYSDNSRARFISCKSPVARDWAEKNKKEEELVTEVGFFGDIEEYFLRAKSKDEDDEKSAFGVFSNVIDKGSNLFDIVMEPEFGAEYYQEARAYMLEGMDLNPYIDEGAVKDPNIPRNDEGRVQLNRVLSYEADIKASDRFGAMYEGDLFNKRWIVLKEALSRLKKPLTDDREFNWKFEAIPRTLIDIGRAAESIVNGSDSPVFVQAYDDFILNSVLRHNPNGGGFASFIKNHPATFQNRKDSPFIIIPYVDTEENFSAQLIRRFNQFANCIESQDTQGVICEDREEKTAYIRSFLNAYKKEMEELESKGEASSSSAEKEIAQ